MRPHFVLLGFLATTTLVLAACADSLDDIGTGEAAQIAAPCASRATMEDGSPSAVAAWKRGRDGWGSEASHTAATGAQGRGYELATREGNAYAALTISQGPSLAPGQYALSFKVKTRGLSSPCPSPDQQWVEVGAKEGAFAPGDFNEGRHFSRAAMDDFAASCATFRTFTTPIRVDLARGGTMSLALKVGSTAAGGGTAAVFDDVALTCVSGACMTCEAETRPPPTNPARPGCETRAGVEVCKGTILVEQELSVERDAAGRQRYVTFGRRATQHETVSLANGRGVKLTFLRTAMGARLYSAVARERELLYQNPTPRVQGNWGQGGFPVFGGVESAWPVEEHGFYGNLDWDSRVSVGNEQVSFVATGTGASVDGSPATVTITTTLRADEEAWHQHVSVSGAPGAENMYYTNMMIAAGTKEAPADLEVILPGVTRAQVHSRGGADGFLPNGANDRSADFDWPMHGGRDVSRINTTIRDWLGLFVAEGTPHSRTYGFFDHTPGAGFGLAVVAEDAAGYHPKFFCGRNITADASGSGRAYCEMWFSPNARTFWDHPRLGPTALTHAVKIVPFFARAAFPQR